MQFTGDGTAGTCRKHRQLPSMGSRPGHFRFSLIPAGMFSTMEIGSREADGSVTRLSNAPESLPSSDLSHPFHLSKDLSINRSNNTWARVFVPRQAFDDDATTKKYPVIFYFHAGGFVVFGAGTSFFDSFYTALSAEVPAVIVSVDYRNAPESRLPAAYEDCSEALGWIKRSEDEWLTKYADFSNCFLMGSSAGGNISYKLGLEAAAPAIVDELKPLEIKGLIMHHPFIGGVERTESELRLADDKVAPLCLTDVLWELSLPLGADRDHEFCNLTKGIKPNLFDEIKKLGLKILVIVCNGDPMIDRQIEFLNKIEENGLKVVRKVEEGGVHCHNLFDPIGAKDLAKVVKQFVSDTIDHDDTYINDSAI